MRLRAMTFNLRFNNPRDEENAWPNRKRLALEVISDVRPDVLGIQEGLFSMLQEVDAALDEYEWIGEGRNGGTGGEFSAVFYRRTSVQPVTAERFWLSHRPETPGSRVPMTGLPRMCTHVRFRKKGSDQEFYFYNTHLDHQSQVARELGADLIVDHIAARRKEKPLPAVLVGDMNADPDNEAILSITMERDGVSLFRDAYDFAGGARGIGATFHGFTGKTDGAPIDYIFHTPEWRICELVVDRRSEGGRYPSDHFPVWCEMELM